MYVAMALIGTHPTSESAVVAIIQNITHVSISKKSTLYQISIAL